MGEKQERPASFQRTYRMNGDGGGIFHLCVPQPMTPADLADFKEWLAIIVRQSERLTAMHYAAPARGRDDGGEDG
jgi:hypothetical protein